MILTPLSSETDTAAVVKIVRLEFTPDWCDVGPDEVREVEPVLLVVVAPLARAEAGR